MVTAAIPPLQTAPLWVIGPPEGRDRGPAGYVEIDRDTGIWWRKTTPAEFNTGWVKFGESSGGSGGGTVIGSGDPSGVVPDGTIYTNRDTGAQWYYDAVLGDWVKNIGP